MMIDLSKDYKNRPKNILDTDCYSKVQKALKSWKTEKDFCRKSLTRKKFLVMIITEIFYQLDILKELMV